MVKSSLRSYFIRLAQDHENGVLSSLIYPLLEVASRAYEGGGAFLKFLYRSKCLRRKRLPYPVISVGNLTWGGTGKTPFVEYLGRRLQANRRTPLILTRGYAHDEVEQMRHHLSGVLIGVGKNRWRTAEEISKKNHVDVAILDDGLQHWPLERELDIVMINALNPFGNLKLIPRGILREPLSFLKRASVVVISHADLVSGQELEALKQKLATLAPQSLVVTAALEPLFFYRAHRHARVPLERVKHERVSTFSAVGTPRSFQLLLSHLGIKPIRNFEFADHHLFSQKELEEIKRISESAEVKTVITTEKDYYRTPDLIAKTLDPLVLAARLKILSGDEALGERVSALLEAKTG